MARELIWVEKERFQGWVCSACGREFRASGPLVGNTIEEINAPMSDSATKSSGRTCALNI